MSIPDAELPLADDERLVWRGVPVVPAYLKKKYLRTTVIGFLILAVELFGFRDVLIRSDAPPIDFLSRDGIVLLISAGFMFFIGLIAATSMIWGRREAEDTDYLLTNQRLLIARGFPANRLFIYPPFTLGTLIVERAKDGTGSLYFRDETPMFLRGIHRKRIGFEGIADVDTVYRLIHETFYEGE